MAPLGLIGPAPAASETAVPGTLALQLRMEDVLASADRLWVRGQAVRSVRHLDSPGQDRHWWLKWRAQTQPPIRPATAQLETKISGHVLTADVALDPAGNFEATFQAPLPPTRRGWRLARHRLTLDTEAAEKCSVSLQPPAAGSKVVVVILPLAFTWPDNGAQRLANSELVLTLAESLRRFENGPKGQHALIYLGCLPVEGGAGQVQVAMTITAKSWPAGHLVLLRANGHSSAKTLAQGLNRLRWLYVSCGPITVLNLEPAVHLSSESSEDRAPLAQVYTADDDPWAGIVQARPRPRTPDRRHKRLSLVPRHPVVFCHGMLAFSRLRLQVPEDWNYYTHLRTFLRDRSVEALYPRVSPTGSIADRAEQLRDQIRHWTDEPVNLIAHSMGGLDARYLVTHLGFSNKVATLTTIATPHRGSYVADWFCASFGQSLPLLTAIEALGANLDGFRDCRRVACAEFNRATPDAPGVRYFSWAAEVTSAHISPALRRTWNLISPIEGPNDGLVSSASARWGECEGVLRADHFAQTPDGVLLRPGEDFDTLGFYARLIDNLARRGY